jgi:guanosine-3',5'-bis(diphosphate) 3'-pyrophosphohydrolase
MILDAISLAKAAHLGQYRRDSDEEYIVHPARVAMRVALLRYTTAEMICAAWLHDVVEDTSVSLEAIRERFGDKVASLVKDLTFKTDGLRELTYQQKKEVQNAHTAAASFQAKSIKILDRLDNVNDYAKAIRAGKEKHGQLADYLLVTWHLVGLLGSQDSKLVDGDLVYELKMTCINLNKEFDLGLTYP